MRAFITDLSKRWVISTELHESVAKAFSKAGIEIAQFLWVRWGEPRHLLGLQSSHGVSLWCEVAPHRDHVVADLRDLGA